MNKPDSPSTKLFPQKNSNRAAHINIYPPGNESISHLGKRKIILKSALGKDMLAVGVKLVFCRDPSTF